MFWAIYKAWTYASYRRRIRRFGWVGTYVPGDADEASLSYTTGFAESLGAPEIVMFGADPEMTNNLMAMAYHELKAGNLVLSDKAAWALDWWEGPPLLVWRAVHPSQIRREYLGFAIWRQEALKRDPATLTAFQLVFSDTGGAFPWDPEFDRSYRPRQPELYLPYEGPDDA